MAVSFCRFVLQQFLDLDLVFGYRFDLVFGYRF